MILATKSAEVREARGSKRSVCGRPPGRQGAPHMPSIGTSCARGSASRSAATCGVWFCWLVCVVGWFGWFVLVQECSPEAPPKWARHGEGAPPTARGPPPKARRAPHKARGASPTAREAPPKARGAPTKARGAPTKARWAPPTGECHAFPVGPSLAPPTRSHSPSESLPLGPILPRSHSPSAPFLGAIPWRRHATAAPTTSSFCARAKEHVQ